MSTRSRRVRARVDGRHLELLEDVNLPAGEEVTVIVEVPSAEALALLNTIDASAGAWSDENHSDLATADDVVGYVRNLRDSYDRGHGG